MTDRRSPGKGLVAYQYYRSTPLTLYLGDAATVLAAMPDDSVDTVVTSPPFWSLRDYGTGAWTGGDPRCGHPLAAAEHVAGAACPRCDAVWADPQYGLEPNVEQYLDRLVAVFDQIRRVLAPAGTCWLNLGDCYTGGPKRVHPLGCTASADVPVAGSASLLPAKNLVGVPWRAAFALQASGWTLRNAIVWAKPNHLSPFCLCCYWFLWPGDRRAERACGEVDGGAVDGLPVPAGSAALVPLASNTVSMANAAVTCVPTAQVR